MLGREKIIFSSNPRSMIIITPSRDTVYYTGVDTANISPNNIQQYTGQYSSDESESKIRITTKEGKIFAKIRSNEILLTPVYKDGFSIPGGDVQFQRDKTGKVNGFLVSIPRARKITFKKI
jgi:hypothetical protein